VAIAASALGAASCDTVLAASFGASVPVSDAVVEALVDSGADPSRPLAQAKAGAAVNANNHLMAPDPFGGRFDDATFDMR
jgi:hypothetical protein